MSDDKIKGLIEEEFIKRIQSAVTRMTNEQNNLLERKEMVVRETDRLSDDEANILQTEIDNLYVAIKVLKSLIF